jgi:hypothetical protein
MIGGAVVTVVNHLRLSEPLPDSAVDAFAAAQHGLQRPDPLGETDARTQAARVSRR